MSDNRACRRAEDDAADAAEAAAAATVGVATAAVVVDVAAEAPKKSADEEAWSTLTEEESAVFKADDMKKMHEVLDEVNQAIISSPKPQKKLLKKKQKLMDRLISEHKSSSPKAGATTERKSQLYMD